MRLNKYEIEGIKKAFLEIFGKGQVYLFGSRIDDNKKGGDIDLYLKLENEFNNIREKKIQFLIKLDYYIGEQKVDVIIANDNSNLIEQEAITKGVLL